MALKSKVANTNTAGFSKISVIAYLHDMLCYSTTTGALESKFISTNLSVMKFEAGS